MSVPFRALLRSEWTKVRSVRATWWCTGLYLLIAGAAGALAAAGTDNAPDAGLAVSTALTGFGVAQLVLVVLGVLAVTSEYSSGMVLVSQTVMPRRTRLLVAKTVVVAVYCALLTAVLAPLCALAAAALTVVPGGISFADPAVLRPLGLQVGSAALVGVLSVGLGAVLRSTAGAVGLGMALVFALPPAVALADNDWAAKVSQALPALRVGEDPFLAVGTPWPIGMGIVGAWALVLWLIGAVVVSRRDV